VSSCGRNLAGETGAILACYTATRSFHRDLKLLSNGLAVE